ncbi:hypothetical protein B0A50_02197 [Salinomyces thailandicus]|uniref:PWI domain-containing protein n=1 Tax=Salinomyces thailandicus TaxID=706561 RepID=A0A4U0U9K2_9PEZI|nr:hypothetical protein B0A50_02197 [Salinomyces thailandica]
MAYNHANNYGPPAGFGGAPHASYGAPPGFGAPPGMAPPAFDTPNPNMAAHFQPPPNMPANFDFAAPIIRMGVGGTPQAEANDGRRGGVRGANTEPLGGSGRGRTGLGSDTRGGGRDIERDRAAARESMLAAQPPTREELARTIFVGGIVENAPADEEIETILRCAGKLRKWTRVTDADGKLCRFGFAEYEDVDSLEAANELYKDGGVEVPMLDTNGSAEKDENGELKKAKLLVVVDEQSQEYIRTWKAKGREDDDARQFRIDGCKEDLRQCITSLFNASAFHANQQANGAVDGDADTVMADMNGESKDGVEVATLSVTLEDELSDIPAEQRAQVAAEIRAFRDRSNRRDLERLRREEELEQTERNRTSAAARVNRLASPAPSGPNGVPVGPRGGTVTGAPAGPKGYRGAQLPNDYVNGVSFVGGANGINREDEDAEESDEELERRRHVRRDEELTRQYMDAERRWQNRERTRSAALVRERERETKEKSEIEREKALIAKRLAEWNDDEEERLGREEYYQDRPAWLRKRATYREREERDDARDRANEEREMLDSRRLEAEARGQADAFLDSMGGQLSQPSVGKPAQPGNVGGAFKISLGSAAAKQRAAPGASKPVRRGLADVEGLLEDEDDAAAAGMKRPLELKPLTDLSTAPLHGQDLSDEEKAEARRALAAEIPTTTEELFAFPVQWRYLSKKVLDDQIKPFVEKKVLESLGVQEELLVDTVLNGLSEKKSAREVVEDLQPALEEESEGMVRKVWRLVVFWAEGGARGLL